MIFFLFFAYKFDCKSLLQPLRKGHSNAYPPSMCLSQNKKDKYVYPCEPHFSPNEMDFLGGCGEYSLHGLVNVLYVRLSAHNLLTEYILYVKFRVLYPNMSFHK